MLKNEKGMAMVLVLFVGVIVTLLGVTLSQVGNTDIVQVERDEDNAQAYYYAKSGVELAIGNILENGIGYLLGQEDPVKFYGCLGNAPLSTEPENPPNHNIEVEITRENNDFIIDSTGIVRKGDAEGAQVASNAVGFTISCSELYEDANNGGGGNGGSTAGQAPSLDMIFALDSIELTGSSEINGDTGTNSTAPNSVIFQYSTKIRNGNLYIGPGADWDDDGVVVVSNGHGRCPAENIPDGDILNLSSVRNYPMPVFPDLPFSDDDAENEMTAGWWPIPEGGFSISESG